MTRSQVLGTQNARAFAYFLAGLYAQRAQYLEGAAALYRMAMDVDPVYHKAINNLGLLIMSDGTDIFVKWEHESLGRAARLFQDAEELFRRAKSLGEGTPEYAYNLGTALSYHGRVAEKQDRGAEARELQRESIHAYEESLTTLEPAPDSWIGRLGRRRSKVASSRIRGARGKEDVERMAFRATVLLAMACSYALERKLSDQESPSPLEQVVVEMAERLRLVEGALMNDTRLDYNRACYYANAGQISKAREILIQLRAVQPGARERVRSDPDLVEIPEIQELFEASTSE